MIFKTAYDTTACSGFGPAIKRTVEAVQTAGIYGELSYLKDSDIHVVEGIGNYANEIPAFAHPIAYVDQNKIEHLIIDVRSFGSWDSQQHEFRVRNNVEYTQAVYRAKYNKVWLTDRPETLRDLSPLPLSVFAAWISESVARRFALDPREQFELAIIAGIYYCTLFMQDGQFEEKDKLRIGSAVSRAVRAKPEDVFEILDQLDTVPKTVHDLCDMASKLPRSVRLSEFNPGLLFAILGGTWYGANAKELVAVALEHPPTWICILLSALNERSYKNSTVAKVAERIAGRSSGDFIRAAIRVSEQA